MLPDPFREVLGAHPNVLMHLAGHTHVHRVTVVDPNAYTHEFKGFLVKVEKA